MWITYSKCGFKISSNTVLNDLLLPQTAQLSIHFSLGKSVMLPIRGGLFQDTLLKR